MLTGDKLETATCIAKSSHLVSRNQDIHIFRPVSVLVVVCHIFLSIFFQPDNVISFLAHRGAQKVCKILGLRGLYTGKPKTVGQV